MEGIGFLIILAIVCLLSGPIALIISIVAVNKIKELSSRLERKSTPVERAGEIKIPISPIFTPAPPPVRPVVPAQPQAVIEKIPEKARQESLSLEQRIGTRWVLIAGVITVFIAAGFFLKFAYDNYWIGPWGRIGIAVVAGFISLAIGEITRRRGYGIAAKGTTALGFAILYAADFSAYRLYELIGAMPAFTTAIVLTAAAMAYAVALNEVVAAFLAMLGGFITPVIISRGENLPMPLFSYVLVLSSGAMLCAYWRKWRAINLLAFLGTVLLYTGWFEKFFRLQLYAEGPPQQLAIALGWLGIFFAVFLALPLIYGLINRVKARKDDVWLVVINAAWTFFYLWTILFELNRSALALCAAGLSAAHLAMMGVVLKRYRQDEDLRSTLLVIGLAFLTTAIPLYWKMNAAILGWTIEGAILVFIGIRYRNILTQIAGAVALGLAGAKLVWQLPMHTEAFRLVINPDFGIWVFVAAILWLCHFLYREDCQSPQDSSGIVAQFYYALAVLVLFSAATLEWAAHCKYNLLVADNLHYISRGQSLILAFAVLLFAVRPICPSGRQTQIFLITTLLAGAAFVVCALFRLHTDKFLIFVNWDFAAVFIYLMSMLCCQLKYRLAAESEDGEIGILSQALYAVMGFLFLAAVTAEWYWHCVYNLDSRGISPQLVRGQIIVFAAGVLAFVVRPLCPRGTLSRVWAAGLAVIGSCFMLILYTETHNAAFYIFANPTFAAAFVFIAALFLSAYILNQRTDDGAKVKTFAMGLCLLAIVVLWVMLSEEIYGFWQCRNLYVKDLVNWRFIAKMWMSVAWAIYGLLLLVVGFWRKLKTLRYLGLGVLGALLLKAFTVDMSDVSTIYRIMAFLATGVTLVGVSYLYQHLKKKGYFDTNLTKV
jgi:uncharacterized membrane protein